MNDEQKKDDEYCPSSERVDGKKHSWQFDGDDPYVICYYCGQRRDARSGKIIDMTPSQKQSDTTLEERLEKICKGASVGQDILQASPSMLKIGIQQDTLYLFNAKELLDFISQELTQRDSYWIAKCREIRSEFHDIQTTTDAGYKNLINGLHKLDALTREREQTE